jgi:hypothetical protein
MKREPLADLASNDDAPLAVAIIAVRSYRAQQCEPRSRKRRDQFRCHQKVEVTEPVVILGRGPILQVAIKEDQSRLLPLPRGPRRSSSLARVPALNPGEQQARMAGRGSGSGARYAAGIFTGLFCVNGKGFGTYTQGILTGFGWVTVVKGTTAIAALGKNLFLVGSTKGTKSSFLELAPTPIKFGTFKLS